MKTEKNTGTIAFRFSQVLLYLLTRVRGPVQRYSDSLQAARSGDRIPVGGRDFRTRPDRPCGLYNGYRVFPGLKRSERGVYHPPFWAFVVCSRVTFSFYIHVQGYTRGWTIRGSSPAGAKHLSPLQRLQTFIGPTQFLCLMDTGDSFPRGKADEAWDYPLTHIWRPERRRLYLESSTRLHAVENYNFDFLTNSRKGLWNSKHCSSSYEGISVFVSEILVRNGNMWNV